MQRALGLQWLCPKQPRSTWLCRHNGRPAGDFSILSWPNWSHKTSRRKQSRS